MTHIQIFSIYCSKEDCIAILQNKDGLISGVHLDLTVPKTRFSLKKIYSDRKKRYALQKGDLIIAIDRPNVLTFKADYEAENLLHFGSLKKFSEWLPKLKN